MADTTETNAHPTGHMTYSQGPAVCEENIFHLQLNPADWSVNPGEVVLSSK